MARTKYLTEEREKSLGIDLSVYPSAGPNPNITGMKKLYWGKDAFCIIERDGNGTAYFNVYALCELSNDDINTLKNEKHITDTEFTWINGKGGK